MFPNCFGLTRDKRFELSVFCVAFATSRNDECPQESKHLVESMPRRRGQGIFTYEKMQFVRG